MDTIADRVSELRKKHGWSQSELARQVTKRMRSGKVKPQNIQQLEIGEIERPRYIQELADTLVTTAEYLLYGEDQKTNDKIAVAEENSDYGTLTPGAIAIAKDWQKLTSEYQVKVQRYIKAALDITSAENAALSDIIEKRSPARQKKTTD